MHRRIWWLVSLALLVAAGAGAGRGGPAGYHTEQEWVVWDVTRAITQMAAYANGGSADSGSVGLSAVSVTTEPPDPTHASLARFAVIVAGRPTPMHVAVTDHLWAPDTYVELARALMPPPKTAEASAAVADTSLLAALTDLRVDVLLAQSARVSRSLTRDINSPSSHEDAALLIGALVLREAAYTFDDVRAELSQMAAHLAIAHARRHGAPSSLNATMAEIVMLAAVNRQSDAVKQLDALSATAPAQTAPVRAWIAALRLRVTGDWRALLEPTRSTLLERLEYARAVNARLSSSRLLDFLDTFDTQHLADWPRIGLSRGFSVEAGHRFSDAGLKAEIDEATQVSQALNGRAPSYDRLMADLNIDDTAVVAGKPPVVRVLEWNLWGPFLQRHLCAHLVNTWRRHNGLGDREVNRKLASIWEPPFGTLRLYPIVLKRIAWQQPEYEHAMTDARELVRVHPELVTADNWHRLREKPDFAATVLSLPEQLPWFTPFVPDGTAYDLLHRTLRPGCPQPPMVDAITRWAAQAPYELWTGWCAASQRSTDTRPTVDTRRAALGPLAEYDLDAVMRLHDHAAVTPEEYLATATKACQLDDEQCDILADHLIENGREEEAARTYESWITRARDAVRVSNNMTWLVRYYYDMGKRDRAMTIAQMAAETYSARGLETLAHLYDQMGRYDDAEETYRNINARYENNGQALAAFYVRQSRRTNNPHIEARAASLVTKQFPNGFEHVTLADFTTSPTDGLAFRRLFARAEHIGLREHDIVVAMDGWRVRNIDQYYVVNRVSHDPKMTVMVWRDGRYQELHLTVPQRYFAVVFYDYHPARRGTSASKIG